MQNGKKSLDYKLSLDGIEDVYMAHLHLMEEDQGYGPMVAWLFPPHHASKAQPVAGPINGVLCSATIEAADLKGALAGKTVQDLVDGLAAGKVYVNVHSERYPSAELKGWLKDLVQLPVRECILGEG